MGIGNENLNLILELKSRRLFENYESVLDFGDQSYFNSTNVLKKFINKYKINLSEKDRETIESLEAKTDNKNILSSSSFLWSVLLSLKKFARLDMHFSPRLNEDHLSVEKIIHDLNNDFEKITSNKFDIVTDFGNNEHVFNVDKTFKAMHFFCKKNGLIWIQQNIYKTNGFYNLTEDFFENLAAYNNYEIIFSSLVFHFIDGKYISTDVNMDLINKINFNLIRDIEIIYIFKKTNDDDFKIPYQKINLEKQTPVFSTNLLKKDYPFERHYVLQNFDFLKTSFLLKEISKRIIIKLTLVIKKLRKKS